MEQAMVRVKVTGKKIREIGDPIVGGRPLTMMG